MQTNADSLMSVLSSKKRTSCWKVLQFLLVLFFLYWSFCFIWKSSFLLKDGKRYFHLFDDAMISMQYSWNFAHGEGLTWNTLYPPVEGFSNPMMIFWMSFWISLAQDKSWACFWIQCSGVFFVLYTAWGSHRLIQYLLLPQKTEFEGSSFSFLAFFLTLSSYSFVYYSLMGMETGLHAALFMFFLLQCFQKQKKLSFSWLVPLSGAFTVLVRPDAFLTVFPVFIWYLWQKRQIGGKSRILLGEIALLSLFFFGYLCFRLFYFGEWVPNTAFLKLGIPWQVRLQQGWEYTVITFKRELGGPLFLLVFSLFFWKKRTDYRLLVFILILQLIYQTWAGGDAFSIQRFIIPLIGVYFALLVTACSLWVEELKKKLSPQHSLIVAPVFLIVCALLFFGMYFGRIAQYSQAFFPFDPSIPKKNWEEEILYRHLVNLKFALALKEAKLSPQAMVAITWAGVTYYADINGVDFFGKCDRYISKLPPHFTSKGFAIPGHCKYDLTWTLSFYQPDVIYDAGVLAPQLQETFQQNPLLRNRYDFYGLFYLKKETPHIHIEKLQKALLSY